MKKKNFLEYIKENIALFDGAMGTEIYSHGIFINSCYDELNLTRTDLIKEIYQSYFDVGADVLETNTFGANEIKLQAYGLADKLELINRKGVELAREVAGDNIWVAGAVGPLGINIKPNNTKFLDKIRKYFRDQIKALVDGGSDIIILETFQNLAELLQAILATRDICDLPLISQMTIDAEGKTINGIPCEKVAEQLNNSQSDVIGINCTIGPKDMLAILKRMVNKTSKPFSVMPNAGIPQNVEGRKIYLSSSEYLAEYTKRFIQSGAKVVGGCCGTQPVHIKAMRRTISSLFPGKRKIFSNSIKKTKIIKPEIDPKTKSEFARKLISGEFVTTVEVVPPRGINSDKVLRAVKKLKEFGVDAINIPDGPRALSRMGAVFLAKLIIDKIGIEPVLHYTCRDRNLLGMMSDFIGIHEIGIRNLLLVTGDPPKMGDLPDASAVFDLDSIGLTTLVERLNMGIDLSGDQVSEPTKYFKGVGVNPGAIDLDNEIERFYMKIEAGAEYAITQPVFDINILDNFLNRIKGTKIPIIGGVWPLVSLRNAEFMNNEVPGADVPDWIMEKMRLTKTKEDARQTGIEIAREAVRQIRSKVSGVQISMPFGNVKYPIAVLEALK